MSPKAYYTASQMAEKLNITRQAIHWHLRNGNLEPPEINLGSCMAWTDRQIAKFLKKRRKYTKGAE